MIAFEVICDTFLHTHPEDAAKTLESLSDHELLELLERADSRVLAGALSRMATMTVARLFTRLSADRASALVDELEIEVGAAVLRRISESQRLPILRGLSKESSQRLRNLVHFSEESAAAYMDPQLPSVAADLTVTQVKTLLKTDGSRALFYIYVVDRSQKLVGVVNMRDLLRAEDSIAISELMESSVTSIKADASSQAISRHPGWKEFHALPVIDDEGRFLGAIKFETLRILESSASPAQGSSAISAGFALGELFLLGLRGVGEGLASGFRTRDGDQ